jgi:hypothetical protein
MMPENVTFVERDRYQIRTTSNSCAAYAYVELSRGEHVFTRPATDPNLMRTLHVMPEHVLRVGGSEIEVTNYSLELWRYGHSENFNKLKEIWEAGQ